MRVPAGIALVLALAPAASAETVARRTPAVGPALAGEAITWGEETRSGAARVVRAVPGSAPATVYTAPVPTGAKTTRGFMHIPGAFGASEDAFAALFVTSTVVQEDADSVASESRLTAVAPLGLLGGVFVDRVEPGCRDPAGGPHAVDADGPYIAVALSSGTCADIAGRRRWIVVHGPAGGVLVPTPGAGDVRHVRIAGHFLAWIQEDGDAGDALVVHDLDRSAAVTSLHARDIGARSLDDAAVQADGTVAFTFSRRGIHRGSSLGVRTPGSARTRVLDRRAVDRGVAIAAGRVLYQRLRRGEATSMVLRRAAGGRGRVLARIPGRRLRLGGLDLDGTRATWAVARRDPGGTFEPAPGARGRIVLRRL